MWNFDVYFSNPPSTTLWAYGLVLSLILRPKTAACNNGAGGYERNLLMNKLPDLTPCE